MAGRARRAVSAGGTQPWYNTSGGTLHVAKKDSCRVVLGKLRNPSPEEVSRSDRKPLVRRLLFQEVVRLEFRRLRAFRDSAQPHRRSVRDRPGRKEEEITGRRGPAQLIPVGPPRCWTHRTHSIPLTRDILHR